MEPTPPPPGSPWPTPPVAPPPGAPPWGAGATTPPGWGGPPRTTPLAGLADQEPPKRDKPVMLVTGIILMLVAISGVIVGIVLLINAASVADDNALANGTIGGPPVSFEQTSDGRITVYLRSSSGNTEVVDSEVSSTTCLVQHGGGTSQLRGSRQGFSVTLGSTATIGSVDVEAGQVAVQCEGSLSAGTRFTVSRGGPPSVVAGFVFIFGGAVLFFGGLVLTIVGAVLRARRRRPPRPQPYASG